MHHGIHSLVPVSAITTRKGNSAREPPSFFFRSQLISSFEPPLNIKNCHSHSQSFALTHALLEEGKDWRAALYFVRVRVTVRGSAGVQQQWRPVNNPGVRSSDGASSAGCVLLSGAIYPKQLLA